MERSGVVRVGVKWGRLSEESNLQPVDYESNALNTLTACIFIDLDGFTALSARTDDRHRLFNLFSRFGDVYGRWSCFGQVSHYKD
jgi:hypothetical protein